MWNNLTPSQQHDTLVAMSRFGSGFVSALAEAWQRADSCNSARLAEAFPDLVSRYGPSSSFYQRVSCPTSP